MSNEVDVELRSSKKRINAVNRAVTALYAASLSQDPDKSAADAASDAGANTHTFITALVNAKLAVNSGRGGKVLYSGGVVTEETRSRFVEELHKVLDAKVVAAREEAARRESVDAGASVQGSLIHLDKSDTQRIERNIETMQSQNNVIIKQNASIIKMLSAVLKDLGVNIKETPSGGVK